MAVFVGGLVGGFTGVVCSHSWVEDKRGNLLAGGSFCGGCVITGRVAWMLPGR
jgi:hypothetical protein